VWGFEGGGGQEGVNRGTQKDEDPEFFSTTKEAEIGLRKRVLPVLI
jgi:hypothetical protein